MKKKRALNYLMLLIGSILILYAQDDTVNNWPVLILGFVLLMGGLFGVYSNITGSKLEHDPYKVQNDEEE